MVIRRSVLPIVGLLLALVAGVEVEDARGVSAEDRAALGTALEQALVRAGASPTGPSVRVRLLGVPTRIRVLAERGGPDAAEVAHAEVDLPRDRAAWPALLDALAEKLVPQRRPVQAPPAPPPAPPPPPKVTAPLPSAPPMRAPPVPSDLPEPSVAPWLVSAAGVVALGVGVGFGLSSRSARSSAAQAPHSAEALSALEARAVGHGWVANVSFSAAALGAITGVVLFLVD